MIRILTLTLLVFASCTTGEKFPFKCPSDGICTDPERPFCDTNGVFPTSQNIPNTCIPQPDEHYCEINGTWCDGDDLYVCAAGKFTTPTTCNLGCSEEGYSHCRRLVPSNNLLPFMDMVHHSEHFEFTNPIVIDVDAERVTMGGVNQDVPILYVPFNENGGVEMAVIFAKSFSAQEVSVVGRPALAIVATGPIELKNTFNLGNAGYYDQNCADICPGNGNGGGGQGNLAPGGEGITPGGPARTHNNLEPLVGGCGSASAGALQLSSSTSVTVSGEIHAMGQGGTADNQCVSGGGAGGSVLIEAPEVSFAGNGGVSANGGSGACFGKDGARGTYSGDSGAVGPVCGSDGNGGTGSVGAAFGGDGSQGADSHGAGGGGAGIIVINTQGGMFVPSGDVLLSPPAKTGDITIE